MDKVTIGTFSQTSFIEKTYMCNKLHVNKYHAGLMGLLITTTEDDSEDAEYLFRSQTEAKEICDIIMEYAKELPE